MNRRTFVLLSGTASGTLLGPRAWGGTARRSRHAVGQLVFSLDAQRCWTLSYHGAGAPVPLVRDAELAVGLGDRWVPLAALEDATLSRRPTPDGTALVVAGTADGVAVEAAFMNGEPGAAAAITVTLSPDRSQSLARGVRYGRFTPDAVLPGDAPLTALVNGYHSWSPSRVVTLPPASESLASHGAIGLSRGRHSLALAFDAADPGEAAMHLAPLLEARSDWLPPRPVRPDGDGATIRIAVDPAGDAVAALAALFAPAPVDRDRFAAPAPAGWCSWYELFDHVSESDVIANLEFCAAHFDRRFLRTIQIDDGYQRAAGDWEANDKFPHGHRWLTDRIHEQGFQAGVWIAPFAVTARSGIPAAHSSWLLAEAGSPLVLGDNPSWGGTVHALDGAHPEVRTWLAALARRIVQEWGYDYLKIDFLLYATRGDAHWGGATHAEAYRSGLAALREGLGPDAFLLGCGAPLQHAVGVVNGMRIGGDVDASWGGIQTPARAAGLRSFYHRTTWFNDPDCLVVRPPLTLDEARVWASIVAVSGGMTLFSDDLPQLPAERIPLLERSIPAAAITGRALDVKPAVAEVAPAFVSDAIDPVPLPGPWVFRTGDDPAYAATDYDDAAWDPIRVPETWERAGHPGYDGVGWYRTRISLPVPAPERTGGRMEPPVWLELGCLDDADETFVNGVKVGRRGNFPPAYRSEWQTFRRYAVPAGLLHWGGENVVAIRVYDGGGDGGFWSVQRDLPPERWAVEGAPHWWTVALVNWEDEAGERRLRLGEIGIGAERCNAYDVWADAALPDVTGELALRLDPHTVRVVALRPAGRPQVIGTTRHVVQGAVDITAEHWDLATRTLSGTSVNLDRRPYAMTIAVAPRLEPLDATAEVACVVRRNGNSSVVLAWPDGTGGRDVAWALRFR
jgi:melibiase-like protein